MLPRARSISCYQQTQNRRLQLSAYRFEKGDRVLLEPVKSGLGKLLSRPLRAKAKTHVHQGAILHDDIIGKCPRDTVLADKDKLYRLLVPSLDEYIRLTPRRVTPIYPSNAENIISKLDIHLSPEEKGDKFEILEAGTGHGALTLFLARAVHAANPPIPEDQRIESRPSVPECNTVLGEEDMWAQSGLNGLPAPFSSDWRMERKAVIHTLDVSPQNSLHARKILRGFRRGIYAGNVDFHIGEVTTWIAEQQKARSTSSQHNGSAFLAHVILDLPDCHLKLTEAATALQTDGKLVVFSPSITQIVACVERIKEDRLPLIAENVLELGPSTSGGREWDVRASFSKARTKLKEGADQDSGSIAEELPRTSFSEPNSAYEQGWNMVCRPRVGMRTFNGGFLGVWRKMQR